MTPAAKKGVSGAARIPKRQQNGFYADHATGDRLRSVTTILSQGVPKEALIYWAGNMVADCAIQNLPYLIKTSRFAAQRAEAYDWLRRAHTRKKDERADIGSAVHKIIEAHILEQPMPDELLEDPEMSPFLDNFLRFVIDWDATFTASEMVVANYTTGYAGTLDYMLRSEPIAAALGLPADAEIMGDTKTGGELRKVLSSGLIHGVYPEAGLQMSAYRKGEQCWLRDGSKVPMPPTAEVGIVLHLRPEGYDIYPVTCGDDVFVFFTHAKQVAEWTSTASKNIVGPALALPTSHPQKDVA